MQIHQDNAVGSRSWIARSGSTTASKCGADFGASSVAWTSKLGDDKAECTISS